MVVHRRIDCLKYNQVIAAQKHPYANKKKKKNIKTIFFYSSQATFCTNTQLWNVYFHLKTIQIAVPVTSNAWLVFLWYRTQKTLKHPHLSQYLQTPQASRRGGKTWFKKAEPFRRRRKKIKQKKNKSTNSKTNQTKALGLLRYEWKVSFQNELNAAPKKFIVVIHVSTLHTTIFMQTV